MAQIFDPVRTFKGLTKAITEGVSDVFPIETDTRILRATNIRVDDSNASPDDYKLQKRLKLEEKDFVAPVYGDLELVDKATGQVIDTKKNFRLMDVPALTSRFSYILGGNEYTVDKQLRMKPGIYTREKENGELESQFNLAKGGGRGFKMWINPEDGIFKLKIGTANPPLYPLLKALGVEDSKIKETWGEAMFTLNQNKTRKSGDSDIMKAYKSIFRKDASSFAQAQVELRDFFDKTVLSEETTKRTLGKGFAKVEPETLLLTSRRLLSVSRGEEEPDDRDSLVYKHIYDTPDLVAARIESNQRKVQNDVRRVMDKKNKITEIVSKDMLNKPVRQFFVQGSVAHAAEQTNPTTMLSEATKVTSLGEGAIGDMNAITDSMRAVNTSHAGVLDPVATPECVPGDTEIFTKVGWVRMDKVTVNTEILCRPHGCTPDNGSTSVYRKPSRVICAPYKGILYGMENKYTGYLVTNNHKMMVRDNRTKNPEFYMASAEDVHNKNIQMPISHLPVSGDRKSFCLRGIGRIDIGDWSEFMGWFLSEGSAAIKEGARPLVHISQSKKVNPVKYRKIADLLSRMPVFEWRQNAIGFSTANSHLNAYLKDFGYCNDKYIPEYLFEAPAYAKQKLFEALMMGDGRLHAKRGNKVFTQKMFTTTSEQLAIDFERLAVDLGYPASIKKYTDKREERYMDMYEVRVYQKKVATAVPHKSFYTREHDGPVYCVTVPGSLILIRRPGKVGIWTGNSDRIGINLHLALGSTIKDKELQTLTRDIKTGKIEFLDIKDTFDKKVAFPDQYKDGKPVKKTVTVMHAGKITEVPPDEVDLSLQSSKQMFTYLTNLVPFSANVQGNRAFMANKMLAQAIPLKYREAPLVQTKMPTGNTFENFVGKVFSTSAEFDGTVKKISYDDIEIEGTDGIVKKYPLYNNFPLNNKSFVHSTPLVKEGDKVGAGQSLADTNYTKDGTLAIGTNLRVGILPYKDSTFEDGYVISESASKKLTSEHLREFSVQIGREDLLDLKSFKAHYPTAMSSDMANKLDSDGVIKRGTTVEPGDIIIAHLQKTEASEEDARLGKLSKKLVKGYRNNAQIWDKDYLGTVTDVYKSGDSIKVFIRTDEAMQIGDKIVNRYGAKGIVSAIVPDNEMPVNKEGTRIDVAISPSAIPGRINPSQVLETAISKVAKKWGRPIKIDNFADINAVKRVRELLDQEGLQDKEELVDPKTGQSLGRVMVGDQYYLKLMHQVAKKINARGVGPGYDIDMQPTKGGQSSARAMDRLTWNALVAHGARENLFEMTAYKAEKNPELWRNIQLGLPTPAPKTPFVFNKLLGYLAAGGVNVKKEGNKLYMLPLTDDEILSRSNGEIDDAKVVISKNLRPVQDGLFDEVKTGGLKGNKWTHVKLAEPILNPVMENAAITLLDMTQKQLEELVSGELHWDAASKKLTKESTGLTSGMALEKMLGDLDVDKEFDALKLKAPTLKGQGLDKANKKLRFLRALKVQGSTPDKAYMIHNVPILPPQFRPMYPLPNGSLNTAPINYLYRDMIMVNKQLKEFENLDDSLKTELRRDLYKSVKAVQGLGDPLVQRGEKKIIGAIETIKGNQPKEGYFQSVVFSKNQDLSGSSTITPSTDMNPDEILLPRDMAWNIFQPFIVKEMTKMGYKPLDAMVMVRDRDQRANMALEKVSKERPVWLNRAPSLHKFSMMAFQPKLYDGKSIGIHPLVVGGFNADIDGDSCIDAVFAVINVKKLEDSISALDICDEVSYIKDMRKFVYERELNMPSNVRIPILQGETVIHLNLADFPRIKGTEKTSEEGNIVFDVPAGIKVLTIDNESHEIVAIPVTQFSIHPDLENYHVETNDGSTLWVSADHSAITIDMDTYQLVKTKPSDLAGKMMPKVRDMRSVAPSITSIALNDYSISPSIKAKVKPSIDLTLDMGHFIGMMVGDGWVTQDPRTTNKTSKAVCFSNVEKALTEKFATAVNSMLDADTARKVHTVECPHTYKGYDCYSESHAIYSVSLAENIHGWIGHGAVNKHLPPFFMSAPEDFRRGLLAGLIDTDGQSTWGHAKSKKNPQYIMGYSTISPRLAEEIVTLCRSLGIRATITPSAKEFRVGISAIDLHDKDIPMAHPLKIKALKEYQSVPLSEEALKFQATRIDLVPFSKAIYDICNAGLSKKRGSDDMSLYTVMNLAAKRGYISRITAETLVSRFEDKLPTPWVELVKNKEVTWVHTVKAVKSPRKVTMYDITAPGPYTFMTNSGIIVQDTMGVYVPVSHKAVEEAKQFMPTKVLEHAGDGRIMVSPGHDIMTGMYYLTRDGKDRTSEYKFATIDDAMKIYKTKTIEIYDDVMIEGKKTSIGKYLVYKALPEGMLIPPGGLNKSTIKAFLKELSLKGSATFNSAMDKLSKLSAQFNIYSSVSIGLEDLEPDYKARDAFIKGVQVRMDAAKSDDEKRKIIQSELPKFHGTVTDYMKRHPESALSVLLTANGKPSFDQFKQLISTPFAVSDTEGKAIPIITTKSFAEGLPVSEYWTTTYGSRTGMIQKRLETAEPGYYSKQILSVTIDNVVSSEDCGTKNGVDTNISNKNDVIGRYVAGTNELIDDAVYTMKLKNGVSSLKLRSPLTCEVREGTCSMCYGLRENGQRAKIGDNVGALAGQFFTEPTTQGSMKAFHSGAVLGAGAASSGGLERLQQLTMVPDYLKDKATLAKKSGKVERIEDNPAGGKNLYIDGEKHLIGVRNLLKVKLGDAVSKGDALTDGPIKPQELMELRGIEATQKYLVDSMQDTFKGMGADLSRKLIETVVRSTTNLTTVVDSGNHPFYVPGDQVPLNEVRSWNLHRQNELDVDEAVGGTLAINAGPYSSGAMVTNDMAKALRNLGTRNVTISSDPIKHSPSIVGVNLLARMGKDWLAKLNTNYIEQGIIKGVQTGDVADMESYNPTGPYVLATGFGKGSKGKY